MDKKFLAYTAALAAAVFYSLNQILNKRVVLAVGTLPALVLVYFFLTIFDFIACLLFGDFFVPSHSVLIQIVFLSLDGAIAIATLFESFKYLPIGVAITLANFSPIILTLIVFLFTGRFPPLVKLFAIVLTVFSIYLITYSGEKKKVPKKVYLLPLITALGWAIFGWESYRLLNVFKLDFFALAFYTSLYMFFTFLSAFFAVYSGKMHFLREVLRFRKILLWAFWGGFLTSAGFILSMLPFKFVEPEDTPVVEALLAFTTPLSALFSYIFLREKLNFRQTIGVALAFFALLVFFFA